jgi:Cu/Ag efflux protein CusF
MPGPDSAIMVVMCRRIFLTALALLLAGCSAKEQSQPKRYNMQGEIKSLDPTAKTATINAGKIGDWMEAMTMEYPIKPDTEFAKLHVGDNVEATVVVNDLKYYVTEVKVVPKQ